MLIKSSSFGCLHHVVVYNSNRTPLFHIQLCFSALNWSVVNSFLNWLVYSGFNGEIKFSRCQAVTVILSFPNNSSKFQFKEHYKALSRYNLYQMRGSNEFNLLGTSPIRLSQLQYNHHPRSISTTYNYPIYGIIMQAVSQVQYHLHPSSNSTTV
jgi:hypothetical protein